MKRLLKPTLFVIAVAVGMLVIVVMLLIEARLREGNRTLDEVHQMLHNHDAWARTYLQQRQK